MAGGRVLASPAPLRSCASNCKSLSNQPRLTEDISAFNSASFESLKQAEEGVKLRSLDQLIKDLDEQPGGGVEIARSRLPSQRFLADLTQMFNEFEVRHILDVGAGEGHFISTLMGRHGYRGHVLSLEPMPLPFEQLNRTSSFYVEWTARNQAVNIRSGRTLYYSSPEDSRRARIARRGDPSSSTIEVDAIDIKEAKRLAMPGDERAALRLNTPQHEGALLARIGSEELSRIFAVLLAVGVNHDPVDLAKAAGELAKAGFVPVDFYPREPWRSAIYREGEMLYISHTELKRLI